jgi:hypothetical protein
MEKQDCVWLSGAQFDFWIAIDTFTELYPIGNFENSLSLAPQSSSPNRSPLLGPS